VNGRTWFPVSSGLLTPEHINRIGASSPVWVFLWMVHHQHRPKDAKENTGLVNGGVPTTCNRIGTDLGIPAETCRRHLATLESGGYIQSELMPGLGKRYYISKPIRWESSVSKNAEANKEQRTKEHQEHKTNRSSVDDVLKRVVGVLWSYFTETLSKSALCHLSELREKMCHDRFRESWEVLAEPKVESAIAIGKLMIDRMKADQFHNGMNDRGKKYLDWELLFRDRKHFEKWSE
jgi:hypothetical protein